MIDSGRFNYSGSARIRVPLSPLASMSDCANWCGLGWTIRSQSMLWRVLRRMTPEQLRDRKAGQTHSKLPSHSLTGSLGRGGVARAPPEELGQIVVVNPETERALTAVWPMP